MHSHKDFPLHNLVKRGLELDGSGWPGRAQILLEKGENPNLLDMLKKTPFGCLVSSGVTNIYAGRIAQLLIEYGANPLINDRALLAAVKQAYPNQGGNSDLVTPALQALLEKETTTHLRGENSENILQLLATAEPYVLFDWFEKKNWAIKIKSDIPEAWIVAEDEKQNNLLHLIWGKNLQFHKLDEAELDNIWRATFFLDQYGIDLKSVNSEGNSVVSLITNHVYNGFPVNGLLKDDENERIWGKIEALWAEEQMKKQTPSARQKNHRLNRL